MAVVAKIASEFDDSGVKAANKAFGDVRRTFKDMAADADDTRGAGEKLGDAYSQAASRLKAELEQLRQTAAVVADSLGPEMTAAMEANGRSVEMQVQEWRKLGLTFDDIKADSEFLARGLKDLDEAGRVAGDQVGDGLKKVAHEGDNSRSVLANMVGNSVQDLGELGGVAGSAGVAIGQLAEYAADGNISLGGLAKVAGPMAAIGLAVAGISKVMEALGKRSKEVKEQTELLVGVQQDLADQQYRDAASKLEEKYGSLILTLKEYGFTTQEVVDAMKGEIDLRSRIQDKIEENTLAVMNGNAEWDGTKQRLADAADQLDIAREAYGNAGTEIRNTTDITNELEGALKGASDKTTTLAGAEDKLSGKAKTLADRTQALKNITKDLDDAYAALIGRLDAEDAFANLAQKFWDLNDGLGDAGQEARDFARAAAEIAMNMDDIPARKKIEIQTMLDNGKYAEVYTLLNQLTHPINVPVVVGGVVPSVGGGPHDMPYPGASQPGVVVAPTPTPGRGVDTPGYKPTAMRGDGPLILQLQVNDKVVQEIMIRGDQLNRGRK